MTYTYNYKNVNYLSMRISKWYNDLLKLFYTPFPNKIWNLISFPTLRVVNSVSISLFPTREG